MTECCGKISTSIIDEGDPVELVATSGKAFGLIELRVVRNWDSTDEPMDVTQRSGRGLDPRSYRVLWL